MPQSSEAWSQQGERQPGTNQSGAPVWTGVQHSVLLFEVHETPVRGVQVTAKQEAIDEAKKNYGYFALMSNELKDSSEALSIYRNKDLVEKAFGNLKERLNLRRVLVSSEQSLDGKLFVEFIALIYLSYIKKAMQDHKLFGKYTIQGLLEFSKSF
jgi:hypothetical protein